MKNINEFNLKFDTVMKNLYNDAEALYKYINLYNRFKAKEVKLLNYELKEILESLGCEVNLDQIVDVIATIWVYYGDPAIEKFNKYIEENNLQL